MWCRIEDTSNGALKANSFKSIPTGVAVVEENESMYSPF
ncbi:hypothetical protein BWQ96_10217 [Gracilariopsis chorda]|uniref:Uncharacterized protein n=1 Tax=Gracilariopsis chorda TaxID=448386 RepID=A0A2V3IDB8_9FLOR|nr:hypothetical protein BWQ96_10217 [Gracilariopsis chorda]|eukprot:PXF40073.1 hypothetical protein BWQ96_10217 [Gracilariopsis chorda]